MQLGSDNFAATRFPLIVCQEIFLMIDRYSSTEIGDIWSTQSRFQIWLDVEVKALEEMEVEGLVPSGIARVVRERAKVNVARALEIEDEVKHDIIAFLTSISESVGIEARFLHRGMTSNDLIDTSQAIQIQRSGKIVLKSLDSLLEALRARALEFKRLPSIGRSHGIHAEPVSFGLRFLSWFEEIKRRKAVIVTALENVAFGKIAGPVGNYSSLSPELEVRLLSSFGLKPEVVPSQIVHRDRHAELLSAFALLGASIERIATEIRHLQRTEVAEVEEGFTKGQKGSSAMPHKKNPILSENLCGIARLIRSYSDIGLQNVALWHERDISHSSAERVILPDCFHLVDFSLKRCSSLIANLVVREENVRRNLEITRGIIFSGALLLRLCDLGQSREDSYKFIQGIAHDVLANPETTFKEEILAKIDTFAKLDRGQIEEIFDLAYHLRYVDVIYERSLG